MVCVQEAEGAGARAEEAGQALAAEQGRAFKLEAQVAELRQALSRTSDLERELEVPFTILIIVTFKCHAKHSRWKLMRQALSRTSDLERELEVHGLGVPARSRLI